MEKHLDLTDPLAGAHHGCLVCVYVCVFEFVGRFCDPVRYLFEIVLRFCLNHGNKQRKVRWGSLGTTSKVLKLDCDT